MAAINWSYRFQAQTRQENTLILLNLENIVELVLLVDFTVSPKIHTN